MVALELHVGKLMGSCVICLECYDDCSAGHIQTSESFLLKVREYALPEFSIEKAKLMRSEVSLAIIPAL